MAFLPASRWGLVGAVLALPMVGGCGAEVNLDHPSEAEQYLHDVAFRRSIVERDLVTVDNDYARQRLAEYGRDGTGWDALEEVDPPSWPLRVSDARALADGGELVARDGSTLVPTETPSSDDEWIELGRRVFFDYPIRADATYEAVARIDSGLESSGFIVDGDVYVGLRVMIGPLGQPRVGITCAMCHASRDPDGTLSGTLSNRSIDVGGARLLAMGWSPGELPAELDSTAIGDLDRLGPGRNDVLPDGVFNPYAIPDFGGLADLPYLHHTANWHHRSAATLAVRCETLFITSSGASTRIPRVLSYALASYFRSLAPPLPVQEPTGDSDKGELVFQQAGCAGCHAPPLYTSARLVTLEEVGTDPAAGASEARHTGYYRIPSLRGVGRAAPYLHHGAIPSLEVMFDPAREEPGHPFGLELDPADRAALIAFLRTI